jgi:subtilisin family serine protease
MRRLIHLLLAAIVLAALLPAATTSVNANSRLDIPDFIPAPADAAFAPGQIIVYFDEGLTGSQAQSEAAALAGELQGQVIKSYEKTALVAFDESADVLGLVELIKSRGTVMYAEPNYLYSLPELAGQGEASQPVGLEITRLDVAPSVRDPDAIPEFDLSNVDTNLSLTPEQTASLRSIIRKDGKAYSIPTFPNDPSTSWGIYEISAQIVWSDKTPSPAICVIDTGADINHPDLYGRVYNGYDYVNSDTVANDDNGHGTHVAGIISAKANNKVGSYGASNSKVIAVKVLNSQGVGTAFDIYLGMMYCSTRTDVKVVNMSLGGPGSLAMAFGTIGLVNANKLLIAAAGNESTSDYTYSYPAAFGPSYTEVVSVGASREASIWVDNDADNIHDSNENYYDCATNFTNYGSWVEAIAPGENILSTTPVKYPFWMNYYYGYYTGYDYMSGTSQAAPFVAATAARVWGANPTFNAGAVAFQVANNADAATYAVDEDVTAGHETIGFDASGYAGDAPFCWPNTDGTYTTNETMTGSYRVNMAEAMQRGGFAFYAFDATTGLPLSGVYVRANHMTTGLVRDTAITTTASPYVALINLKEFEPYNIYVSKSGFTYGYQKIITGMVAPSGSIGFLDRDSYIGLATSSSKYIHAITNWNEYYFGDEWLFTPSNANTTQYMIGKYDPGNIYYNDLIATGSLGIEPYAKVRFDGSDLFTNYLPIEAVTILRKPGYNRPYFTSSSADPYELFHSASSYTSLNNSYPITRIWNNGRIISTIYQNDLCSSGENWWKSAEIYASAGVTTVMPVDNCGTTGLWPY